MSLYPIQAISSLLQQNNTSIFSQGAGGWVGWGGCVGSKRQMFLLFYFGLELNWVSNLLVHFVSLGMLHAEAQVEV